MGMIIEQTVPQVADRILVPLANPANAESLLRLALSLANPKSGRVIAVFITVANVPPRPGAQEALEEIVATLAAEQVAQGGVSIELFVDVAPSAERGILDAALERHVDLIVLGIYGRQEGEERLALGHLVEAVARTAPHNLLVYRGIRALYGEDGYEHVLVPVDGSPESRLASRIGLRLAHNSDALMTACHIQQESGKGKREQAIQRIDTTLDGLGGAESVRRVVEREDDLVDGILHRAHMETLVVVGISEQERSLDGWLTWDVPERLLNDVPGSLILVKQSARDVASPRRRLWHRLVDMMPTLTPDEQAQLSQEAQEMARPTTNYFMLVILSALIASIGLLQNSAAVIIGAMLIAPLMLPLMGFALGLTQGKLALMRRALLTVAQGVGLVLVLMVLMGLIAPIKTPTSEMTARGTPSLLDLGVALFSGAAGAFALARKDIQAAVAGVAIAAALMPPLCTVGMAFAFGETALAGRAFLLFLTNIISISFASAAVFIWMGMRLRAGSDDLAHYRTRVAISVIVLMLLSVPLSVSLSNWVRSAAQENTAWVTLREVFGADDVLDVNFNTQVTPMEIVTTIRVLWELDGDQVTEEDLQLFSGAESLLEERLGIDVALYMDARPLISASDR